MKKNYDFLDNTRDEKQMRIELQLKADEIRKKWAQKGLFDIFEILENESILIRKPLKTTEISGFTAYFDEHFIVFLNSSYTLGHERFSGAHELAHLILHKEKLLKENLIAKDEMIEREATVFAVEFLMPRIGVEEIFQKIVGVESNKVEPKHVVKMHNYFKVSYKAMLKRLVYLNLCDKNLYDSLSEICEIEHSEEFRIITKREGYDCSLITKSNVTHVSKEYEEIVRSNYETGKISYKRLEYLLGFMGKRPEDYGYEIFEEEE